MSLSWLPEELPAMAPPPGQRSDFLHPGGLSASLITINAVFLPLMLLFVGIRFYVRGRILHAVWWDDWMILFATLSSIAHTVMMLWCVHLKYGVHLWNVRLRDLTPAVIGQEASLSVIYPVAILSVKLAVCVFYIRIFDRVMSRALRFAISGIMVFIVLFYTAEFIVGIVALVRCDTIFSNIEVIFCWKYAEDISIITGGTQFCLTHSVNTATDIYLVSLPIPVISKMQLSVRRKWGVRLILVAGALACCISAARLVWVAYNYKGQDVLYTAALTTELTSVGLNSTIIIASLVALPSFIKSPLFRSETWAVVFRKLGVSSLGRRGAREGSRTSLRQESSYGQQSSTSGQRSTESGVRSVMNAVRSIRSSGRGSRSVRAPQVTHLPFESHVAADPLGEQLRVDERWAA